MLKVLSRVFSKDSTTETYDSGQGSHWPQQHALKGVKVQPLAEGLPARVDTLRPGPQVVENETIKNSSHLASSPMTTTDRLVHLLVGIEKSQAGNGGGGPPPRDTRLAELKSRGFVALATDLERNKGYPWDEIRLLGSPGLMEQLVTLWRICEKADTSDQAAAKEIMRYALERAKEANRSIKGHPNSIVPNLSFAPSIKAKEASTLVGRLIVLSDESFSETALLLKNEDEITTAFNLRLGEVADALLNHYENHRRACFQESDRATGVLLPRELAKLLITSTGRINFGIIGEIESKFLDAPEMRTPQERSMVYALQLLQRSPRLRTKFDAITKPEKPGMAINDVIRASLGYPADVVVTDVIAKKAALTGIMSHLRQGRVGSCFATFLAIQLLSSHLDRCLDDFKELLEKGQLTRMVDGIEVPFPFLMRMSNDNIDMEIEVTKDGKIQRKYRDTGFIWEAPGLIAACQALGIEKPKEAIKNAFHSVWAAYADPKMKEIKLTPKELLKNLCLIRAAENPGKKTTLARLYRKAAFAFEGETVCPLLRVWEYTIAGMSEADATGLVRQRMVMASLRALYSQLSGVEELSEEDRTAFLKECSYLLCVRGRMQYDPDVVHQHISNDGHSSEGAFVLYDTHDSLFFRDWKRVDSPQQYGEFMRRIASEAWLNLKDARGNAWDPSLDGVPDIFSPKLTEERFLCSALYNYAMMNILFHDPIRNYQTVDHAPWVDKTGNNTMKTLMVYLELDQPLPTENVLPQNGQHLLTKVIDIVKSSPKEVRKQLVNNPHKLVPVRTPGCHAFNLMLGNPRLAKAWKSNLPTSQWIEENILNPGKELCETTIPDATRQKVLQYCHNVVITEKNREKFDAAAEEISGKLSIRDFRNELIKVVLRVEGNNLSYPSRLHRRIDTRIVEHLPRALKKAHASTAIHFADTNWNEGSHDLHFCFVVNPGTGELEIWQVQNDDQQFIAMDQHAWLLDQEWEFFIDPTNVIPQNELLGRNKVLV